MSLETDVAWCAGFFDGEGHVSYRRSYPSDISGKVSPALMCTIAQASENIEVLEHFQLIVALGKIKGPYPMPNGKPQHRLIFAINEVETLLKMLLPYLKSKKTLDFQVAIMAYYMHDSEPTEHDYARLATRKRKK